jgi:hypothetical protein
VGGDGVGSDVGGDGVGGTVGDSVGGVLDLHSRTPPRSVHAEYPLELLARICTLKFLVGGLPEAPSKLIVSAQCSTVRA